MMRVKPSEGSVARKAAPEPEVHFVGSIKGLSGHGGGGAFAAFSVRAGATWECVGGETEGQTQVDEPLDADCIWSHPIDLHYYTTTLQGWPHLVFDVYRLDELGGHELIGYSFCFLPTQPGAHKVECGVWRPEGNTREEAYAFFLGGTPELVSRDLVFDKARDDRCRLYTRSGGRIHIEVEVLLRNARPSGVDVRAPAKDKGGAE